MLLSNRNAFTVDLEDWHHSIYIKEKVEFQKVRFFKITNIILDILKRNNITATFFVLGQIAETMPDLVLSIAEDGHEIASHGYNHSLLNSMTYAEIEDDICSSIDIIEKIIDKKVLGYRAPAWSLYNFKEKIFNLLRKKGIIYDSSLANIEIPFLWKASGKKNRPYILNNGLVEIPPSCFKFFNCSLPFAGGVSLRLYPYFFTKFLIKKFNLLDVPCIIYIHPWDCDMEFKKVTLKFPYNILQYANIKTTIDKLQKMVEDFDFLPMHKIAEDILTKDEENIEI